MSSNLDELNNRLDAQSLREMRARAEQTERDPYGMGGRGSSLEQSLARHVVALTGEVERLVGCVAEAERRAEEAKDFSYRSHRDRAARAEAALADARDALERTRIQLALSAGTRAEKARRILDEVLVRLNQESEGVADSASRKSAGDL